MITNPPTAAFPFLTVAVSGPKLVELTWQLVSAGLHYGLGAKIDPIDLNADQLAANGIDSIDCSGFTRWAIYHASAGKVLPEDGSVQQHDQIKRVGFKASTPADARYMDGVVRIAFLPPNGPAVGHVLLIYQGYTMESFGHHGPGRRRWGALPFMDKMQVYVLALP